MAPQAHTIEATVNPNSFALLDYVVYTWAPVPFFPSLRDFRSPLLLNTPSGVSVSLSSTESVASPSSSSTTSTSTESSPISFPTLTNTTTAFSSPSSSSSDAVPTSPPNPSTDSGSGHDYSQLEHNPFASLQPTVSHALSCRTFPTSRLWTTFSRLFMTLARNLVISSFQPTRSRIFNPARH